MVSVFFMLAHFASAEVVYKDGTARIQATTQNLMDIKDTNYLEIKNGVCYVKKPIVVSSTGTLNVDTTSCNTVNMYAASGITVYGKIYFDGVKVTSYDPNTGKPIELSRTNYSTVRPDVITRSSAQYFSAKNSEFSYLGYYNSVSSHWGVALRFLPKADITNSKFHHNYFGFYTFDSDNVTIQNSEVHDNLEYGIDIHDFSDNFNASNNVVYNNGNHGIILSKYNENGKIIGNKVYDHTQNAFVKGKVQTYGTHGIELHLQSNHALVSGNELTNNRIGIKLANSDSSQVKSNKVVSDLEQGFFIDQSSHNEITSNQVVASVKEPLYSFNSFYNKYDLNNWGGADDILYVKIDDKGAVTRYKFPAPGADAKLNSYATPPGSSAPKVAAANNAQIPAPIPVSIPATIVSKIAVNDAPRVIEADENVEIDTARDAKLGIKVNSNRTRDQEKAYVDKIKKYEKEIAKDLIVNKTTTKAAKNKITPADKSMTAAEKADTIKSAESNNDKVEVDKVRDKTLGIKSVNTRQQEQDYVDKIAQYERKMAKK